VDEDLAWSRHRLQVTPDGVVWLVAGREVYKLVDDAWTLYLAGQEGNMLGVDHAGRVWMASEEADQVMAWDGAAWTSYSADAGWTPLTHWSRYVGWGQVDSLGRVWLSTSQDVRAFDGERWTVFTPGDMNMGAPLHEDLEASFAILESGGLVWVGECDWGGPGPFGGRGARWSDSSTVALAELSRDLTGTGENWQGADSPVASGCVTLIEQDDWGRVWLGVDGSLWRYDGDWTLFAPPEAPEGLRNGFLTDLALDPAGDPWLTLDLCGGGSCYGWLVHYYVHDGVWTQIGDLMDDYYPVQGAVFVPEQGGFDTPWLFWEGNLYRVLGDMPELVARFVVYSLSVDAAGQVWLVAWHEGQAALWTFLTKF
jgi:hypothetical protein